MQNWLERGRWLLAQLCWNAGSPDPRFLHGGFTALVAGVLLLRAWDGVGVTLWSWPVAGFALAAAGFAVLLLPGAVRLTWLSRGLAVVSIGSLGLLAAGHEPGGASSLLVLPVLYLGLELGLRGAALAVAATLAFITVPGLYLRGTEVESLERLLVLPIVAGIGAAALTAGLTAARTAQARAEAREADLVEAMKVIERNRRSAEAIFEAVDIGLALLGQDGEPLLINQRLVEFSEMAYPGGMVTEGWVFDETGSVRLDVCDVPTSRARRGEEFDDVRVWVGKDEPSRRAMSISARRVEDGEGNLWGAAISYADVTDLMRALQIQDEFIAQVSHELRTPLTSIIGYVSVMREREDLDRGLTKHLEVVARNASRLQRLVDDLLDEGQHQGLPAPVGDRPTDLATIVRDCVVAARPHAERAGVRLSVDVPAALPYQGDPQRLGQVIDNLVSNAIKYTPDGGRAEVSAAVQDDAVVIRVTDTGMGVSADDQAQLFNRFFRTREATLAAIQGVGLGLSITKSIVEGHGGRIEVESEVGRGSEFRVLLPARVARLAS